ncbi:MAG: class I tRNA ligase family protein, partial [Clostridiales bacterium]|nr:class I tRNA ligase family protein [Clostridiales bacterium]
VHYWMHNGFLNIDNKKMSKSQGNFFTVRDAAQVYGYEPIRLFMLSAHYRTPLNYSAESLQQAQAALERLYSARDNLTFLVENGREGGPNPAEQAVLDEAGTYRERFDAAMDDDFNTADAVSVLFELVRAANRAVAPEQKPTKAGAAALLKLTGEFTDVLGLLYAREKEESLDDQVEALIARRQAARAEKNWAEADHIRDELKGMGIILKDTKQGVQWKRE